MTKMRVVVLLLAVSAAGDLPGRVAADDHRYEFTQVHMGVPVRIVLYTSHEGQARTAAEVAFARIAALDAMMSDYRDDSELSRIGARAPEWVPVSPELLAVLTRAVQIAAASEGAFDPTVGPLVALWRAARRTGRMPDAASLSEARSRVGWRRLQLDPSRRAVRLTDAGMRLDLGGIAKGWILQDAMRMLRLQHVRRALVVAGGDIVAGDPPPATPGWRIETPDAEAPFAQYANRLRNAALSTSGPSAQFVEIDGMRYSHVIDPRSGLGLTNRTTAYAIARDGATADGIATALTVVGRAGLRTLLSRFPTVRASLLDAPPDRLRAPVPVTIPRARRSKRSVNPRPRAGAPVRNGLRVRTGIRKLRRLAASRSAAQRLPRDPG